MPAQGLDPTAQPGNSTSMPTDDSGGASVPSTPRKKQPYDSAQKKNLEQRVDQEAGKLEQNIMSVNHMVGFKTITQVVEKCDRCGNPPIGGITKTVGNQEHCLNCILEPTSLNTTHKEGWKAVTTAHVVATPGEDRHARRPRI